VALDFDRLCAYDPLSVGARGGAIAHQQRRYFVLDVFTDAPLQGNSLAVFADARELSSELMQRLARELNLSETAFVLAPTAGGDARVRIFTPARELPFAGHPVLGSAVLIAAALGRSELTLETGSGPVAVKLDGDDGAPRSGVMAQPIPRRQPFARGTELLAALGVQRSELPLEAYDNGPLHVLVALQSERAVAMLAPDMRALAALGPAVVSCFAGAGRRWKTRVFAPAEGVAEDPATGSAAGPLAVHLATHGRIAFGEQIEIRQGAELERPSLLRARAVGSRERVERVEVGGSAVIVACGEFATPGATSRPERQGL
jgi:trans-2,3-dihydro-3-hydroxyanthranilate isomerase